MSKIQRSVFRENHFSGRVNLTDRQGLVGSIWFSRPSRLNLSIVRCNKSVEITSHSFQSLIWRPGAQNCRRFGVNRIFGGPTPNCLSPDVCKWSKKKITFAGQFSQKNGLAVDYNAKRFYARINIFLWLKQQEKKYLLKEIFRKN